MEILLFPVELILEFLLRVPARAPRHSPAPDHLVEGTTLHSAFIGDRRMDFMDFFKKPSNSRSNHP
jgi:hypothetical protein